MSAERPTASTACSAGRFDNACGRDVLTQIDDFEAMVLEQGTNDILTDVVDIPFDCGHQDLVPARHLRSLHGRLQPGESSLHCFRRQHHLGKEDPLGAEAPSDLLQSGEKTLVADRQRR